MKHHGGSRIYVMICEVAVSALGLADLLEWGLYQTTKHYFGQLGFEQDAVGLFAVASTL